MYFSRTDLFGKCCEASVLLVALGRIILPCHRYKMNINYSHINSPKLFFFCINISQSIISFFILLCLKSRSSLPPKSVSSSVDVRDFELNENSPEVLLCFCLCFGLYSRCVHLYEHIFEFVISISLSFFAQYKSTLISTFFIIYMIQCYLLICNLFLSTR